MTINHIRLLIKHKLIGETNPDKIVKVSIKLIALIMLVCILVSRL